MEIAYEIGRALRESGLGVDVEPIENVDSLERYDGVVLGSAVYVGRWLPSAVEFVRLHQAELSRRPVWLFSSGPIGSPDPKPATEAQEAAELVAATGARSHSVFGGKIDRDRLSFGERAILRVVRAPEGDFRDWVAVDAWASDVGRQLTGATAATPVEVPS